MRAPAARDSLESELTLRARRATRRIAEALPPEALDEAVHASSDIEALVLALLQSEASKGPVHGDKLRAARLRGLLAQRQLLEERGGTLTASEVAKLLGITRQAVNQRRQAGRLLGLSLGRHGYAYPIWQLDGRGVIPGFEETLATLEGHDPWMQAQFFLSRSLRLENQAPLDALKQGDVEGVREAAAAYGEHGAD